MVYWTELEGLLCIEANDTLFNHYDKSSKTLFGQI